MMSQPDNPWARIEAEVASLRSRVSALETAQMLQAVALTQHAAAMASLLQSIGELPGESEPARRGPGRPPKVN